MEQNTKYVMDRLRKVADGSTPTPSLQVLARQGADAIEELDGRVEELEAQLAKASKPTRRKSAAKTTEKPAEKPAEGSGDEGEADED